MLTGAQVMIKCLEAEGIKAVFGYPGVAIVRFTTVYMIQVSGIFWFAMNRTADIWPADMPV